MSHKRWLKLRNVKCKATAAPDGESVFSEQTYAHANLYVPEGTWDAYAFSDNWYQFANIKEYSESSAHVSKAKAYTMMDEDFKYAVYDEVNDCVRMVESHQVNEENANTSWTMQTIEGKKYLYNLGAKKYVARNNMGGLSLSASPASVDVEDIKDGISINGGKTQWNFVSNNNLFADNSLEDAVTAITTAVQSASPVVETYTIDGRKTTSAHKGISIIRHADGTVNKVVK